MEILRAIQSGLEGTLDSWVRHNSAGLEGLQNSKKLRVVFTEGRLLGGLLLAVPEVRHPGRTGALVLVHNLS